MSMNKLHPYSSSVVAAAVVIGVFFGVMGTTLVHRIASSLGVYSAPRPVSTVADSLAVEANVDSTGRVLDYQVLSETKYLPPQAKNALIFTTFRPATFMGKPTSGSATIIFSYINDSAASPLQKQ